MGNFEKLGVLVIIILVAVLFVIVIFGGTPQEGLYTNEVPARLSAADRVGGTAAPATGPVKDEPATAGSEGENLPWPQRGTSGPEAEGTEMPPAGSTPAEEGSEAATPEEETPPAPVPGYLEHVVKPHESYWKISCAYYGSPRYVNLLKKANPTVDPDAMPVGVKLRIPNPDRVLHRGENRPREVEAPLTPSPSRRKTYTVKKGDSLSSIARKTMGPNASWKKLYAANRDRIGPDPDDLPAGLTLTIP